MGNKLLFSLGWLWFGHGKSVICGSTRQIRLSSNIVLLLVWSTTGRKTVGRLIMFSSFERNKAVKDMKGLELGR